MLALPPSIFKRAKKGRIFKLVGYGRIFGLKLIQVFKVAVSWFADVKIVAKKSPFVGKAGLNQGSLALGYGFVARGAPMLLFGGNHLQLVERPHLISPFAGPWEL
jgi:hypothetical protein